MRTTQPAPRASAVCTAAFALLTTLFLPALVLAPLFLTLSAPAAWADTNPFANGWVLDEDASELRFITLKRGNIAETNRFSEFSGEIDPAGNATLRVTLNSVQTYIDIRDVRLRFLFFETYKHPLAQVTLRIDRGSLRDLPQTGRKVIPVDYTLALHGRSVTRTTRLTLQLVGEDRVYVSNTDPIFVGVNDFDLLDGLLRLEEAAALDISPLAIVSINLAFDRAPEAARTAEADKTQVDTATAPGAATPPPATASDRIGPWNATNPDAQTCLARLLTLGRLDTVRFEPRSARIADSSTALVTAYADALVRCPDLRVRIEGLVSRGEDNSGALASQRAQAISRSLWARGVQRSRLQAVAGGRVTPSTEPVGGGRARITALD